MPRCTEHPRLFGSTNPCSTVRLLSLAGASLWRLVLGARHGAEPSEVGHRIVLVGEVELVHRATAASTDPRKKKEVAAPYI